jgi:hypothetical protein
VFLLLCFFLSGSRKDWALVGWCAVLGTVLKPIQKKKKKKMGLGGKKGEDRKRN